jgi:hypothetical protein
MRKIIRYEMDGEDLVAVCEDDDGNRWYMPIIKNGEVVF